MTEQQKQHAAEVLLGTKALTGGDDPKFLPKLYVVNGKCYMFLNVARRAALGTKYPIEVLDIEDAWNRMSEEKFDKDSVAWDFDTNGSTFDGKLFCDNPFLSAGMVLNPVINSTSHMPIIEDVLDREVNLLFLTTRAQNLIMKVGCRTYRQILEFGRDPMLKMRNVGITTISELDAEMDRAGLFDYWKYNKPIK